MSEQFKDVEYVPGGATLNAVRVAQVMFISFNDFLEIK